MLLDGDQLRHGLNGDLGFSPSDRAENVRRAGEVARLFFVAGHIVLCTFVSPFARDRDAVRGLFPPGRFAEIYVKASVSTLRARDVKGLYARESTLSGLTAYEPPEHADLTIDTDSWSIETAIASVMALVKDRSRKR
jgi:bifunctional enzyme CysN/CysC